MSGFAYPILADSVWGDGPLLASSTILGSLPDTLMKYRFLIFPQIAIAIGVLTSNRGGGRRTTLADWTWHQGAIAGCSGRGAIAHCHCSVGGGGG